ncbi:hypothetical protein ITJ86_12415 [Winogradskyella sp. F6397]|uniref:Uncharacterized protein n=2 Tax=Winogradskyella marina TaxID=2785530 RepID=A0ABS0EK09_9FLAO|nr:hypothetical protein [Winogradskyella marina]
MTAMAWSINPSEMLYLPLWILTIIGLILFLTIKKIGTYSLILIAILWLLQISETLGWFLTFEPENLALWGIFGLPTIACILITFFGINYGLENQKKFGLGIKGIALLIPIVGILSYANKTYDKNVFSEFYDIKKTEYKAVFKPQPSDTRQFEMEMSSTELRNLVKDKATFVANHHYFPNARFKVNMTFSKINEIELYQVADHKLEQPIKWKIDELNGETEFLK